MCSSVPAERDVHVKDEDICSGLDDLGASTPEQIIQGTKDILYHVAPEIFKDIEEANASPELESDYDFLVSSFGATDNLRHVKRALLKVAPIRNSLPYSTLQDMTAQYSKAVRSGKYSEGRALYGELLIIDSLLTDTSVVYINEIREAKVEAFPACELFTS